MPPPPIASLDSERKESVTHVETSSPHNLVDDLYVAPRIANGAVSSAVSRDQRVWDFERDWTA